MDPDLEQLYREMQADIQSGAATPEEVEAWLRDRGAPSFRALGQAYANTLRPTPEEQVAAEGTTLGAVADAIGSAAASFGHAGTLNLLDNAMSFFAPEHARAMEAHQQGTREAAPAGILAAELAAGSLLPGGQVLRGTGGLLSRGLRTAAIGGAEGAAYGYGTEDLDATEAERRSSALGGAILGTGAGVLGAAGGAGLAKVRRVGEGANTGQRLGAFLAENLRGGRAPEINLPGGIKFRQPMRQGARNVAVTDDAAPTMAGRLRLYEARKQAAGDQAFGRFDNVDLLPGTEEFIERLRTTPGMGGVVSTIKPAMREIAPTLRGGVPVDELWTFRDAQRLHRRLQVLSNIKAVSPTEAMKADDLRILADELRGYLDGATGGQFSVANELYARAAAVPEAYEIGLGRLRNAGETTLDPIADFDDPDRLEALIEQLAPTQEAEQALRAGLADDFISRTTTAQGDNALLPRVQAAAVGGKTGDRRILRALFPRGVRGDQLHKEFLSLAAREFGVDEMAGTLHRGTDVAGRSALTRGLMSR